MPLVLVVDDETNIVELLKFNLAKESYQVASATNGLDAVKFIEKEQPDLIILDIMLPQMDGYEVLRSIQIKPETRDIPVIMLSAKGELFDKVLGLELGADDYITKPFSPRELLARVKACLRRKAFSSKTMQETKQNELVINNLVIRPDRYEAVIDEKKIDLTHKEFELLHLLAANPGRVFTRDFLLERIWGYDYDRETRTVDVHIRYLRQKIERNPASPEYIETVRGVGYRFHGIS